MKGLIVKFTNEETKSYFVIKEEDGTVLYASPVFEGPDRGRKCTKEGMAMLATLRSVRPNE